MEAQCSVVAKEERVREKYKEILQQHYNRPTFHLREEEIWSILHKGVVLNNNKLFWLDEEGRVCIELFARALAIAWANGHCTYIKENLRDGDPWVELAEPFVFYLDVEGRFNVGDLSSGVEYEVLFDIQIKHSGLASCRWDFPVKFCLITPSGSKIENEKKLDELIGRGETKVTVGKFQTPAIPNASEKFVVFKMYEHGAYWKKGLVIRGVIIQAL